MIRYAHTYIHFVFLAMEASTARVEKHSSHSQRLKRHASSIMFHGKCCHDVPHSSVPPRRMRRPRSFLAAIVLTTTVLSSAHGHWLDPDTPSTAHTEKSLVDGRVFGLVMSDEFNVPSRSFDDGQDSTWTAIHKNDYTNGALQFYDRANVRTTTDALGNGYLNITTSAEHTVYEAVDDKTLETYRATKTFKSGMLQSWNKFCWTGGIVEVRGKLPGDGLIGGLWPAIWLLGNLARATYVGSSNWIWPWSFDRCDRGLQPKQAISACAPHPHFGMNSWQGRGAPEMDILEAMPGNAPLPPSKVGKPYYSTSLQIAPGVSVNRPGNGGPPGPGQWYENLEYGPNSSQNIFFYGTENTKNNPRTMLPDPKFSYQADAVSGNTQMNAALWDEFHKFRLEWELPQAEMGDGASEGYVRWYMDDALVYGISGESLSNKMKGSQVPTEPQYILLNTAMSSSWGFPLPSTLKNCPGTCYDCLDEYGPCGCGFSPGFCRTLPAHFLIDYVRVWQFADDPKHKVGCSTPERPTKAWIEGHVKGYKEDSDEEPLKAVVAGGGPCQLDDDCGGAPYRGSCRASGNGLAFFTGSFGSSSRPSSSRSAGGSDTSSAGTCACKAGWTGPWCRAVQGSDPINWEALQEEHLPLATPWLPAPLAAAAAVLAAAFVATVVYHVEKVRQGRRPERDKLLQMQNSPNLSRRALPGALLTRSGASSGGNLVAEKYTLVPNAAEEFRRMR